MGTEMVAFLESGFSRLDCLDCLAEKGENPKVSGRAVSTSVDVGRTAAGARPSGSADRRCSKFYCVHRTKFDGFGIFFYYDERA